MNLSPKPERSQAQPTRLLHTMLRVTDLNQSVSFYCHQLGMTLHRVEDYPDGRFSLAFLGYGDERTHTLLELTHNWDEASYVQGTGYGHIALAVTALDLICERLVESNVKLVRAPGPMTFSSPHRREKERIAFIEDPDGYRIELVELGDL